MKTRLFVVLVVSGTLLIIGCAGSRKIDQRGKQQETFDPQTLNDDDILIEPGEGVTKTEKSPQQTGEELPVQASKGEGRRLIEGYRVQLIATSNRETAERVKGEAIQKFSVGVYVEYHPPFYKVMIGDCRTREEADILIEQARTKGYIAPLRVQTDIWTEDSGTTQISGWRVQLHADTDLRRAQVIKEEATKRLGQVVYIEFIEPYYRVRVGNYRTEDEAREMAKEAKAHGYHEAFPVRSLITVTY